MQDDIDNEGFAGIYANHNIDGNSCNKLDFDNRLLDTDTPGFEATHNVNSNSSIKI